jgi:hypothetical protein
VERATAAISTRCDLQDRGTYVLGTRIGKHLDREGGNKRLVEFDKVNWTRLDRSFGWEPVAEYDDANEVHWEE